ncbi:hypothetical protein MXB_759, partial [Myxobolus squamalis]
KISILTSLAIFGSYLIEHCLSEFGFSSKTIVGIDFSFDADREKLFNSLQLAEALLNQCANGIIKVLLFLNANRVVTTNSIHFYSINTPRVIMFDLSVVDEFYSQIEHQKTELQLLNREKTANSKVQNVIEDHQNRLKTLETEQVDDVLLLINSALANRMSWSEIGGFISDAKSESHPLASVIDYTKFPENKIALLLKYYLYISRKEHRRGNPIHSHRS